MEFWSRGMEKTWRNCDCHEPGDERRIPEAAGRKETPWAPGAWAKALLMIRLVGWSSTDVRWSGREREKRSQARGRARLQFVSRRRPSCATSGAGARCNDRSTRRDRIYSAM